MCPESSVKLTGGKKLAGIHMFTKQEIIKLIIHFSLPFKCQHLHKHKDWCPFKVIAHMLL